MVPAEVRRRLGVGPGSVLEWDQDGAAIVVRRAARFTSDDLPLTHVVVLEVARKAGHPRRGKAAPDAFRNELTFHRVAAQANSTRSISA